MAAAFLPLTPAMAQDAALRPGEAYVTRFSGTAAMPGAGGKPVAVIDPNGTVGSVIDLRSPGQPPQGQHWIDEPQRQPLTATQVGQVFGVAIDDAPAPSIYVASTAAFGLHRTSDNTDWMPGMFGPGGPAAIYRLDPTTGYQPMPFAQVTLNGRPNTGAGLGNIAYDRFNRQIFASDLETGMIHRLRVSDGADLGTWDHGTQARAGFLDVEDKTPKSLAPIPFNPSSRALVTDCPTGNFARSPECWNIAESGRRVWGVGVMRNAQSGETRLYYSVWSSPAFGNAAWAQAPEEERRNAIWSVRLAPDGAFDGSDVRREFLLPDFFTTPADIARAGHSSPVSDISFQACGSTPVMLVAERGGLRNLGLDAEDAFAMPHESRSLRYEYDSQNGWRPIGRYDVGVYARTGEGEPYLRANCAGGASFAYGYDATFNSIDATKTDQFVWNSGDALCSPDGPCLMPGAASAQMSQPGGAQGNPAQQAALAPSDDPQADDSHVHGIQGTPENAYDELIPNGALAPAPSSEPYPSNGIGQSYMVDVDINIDAQGNPVGLDRNDATRIGDIAVYQVCPQPMMGFMPLPPPVLIAGHSPSVSHAMYASHGRRMSHFRFGSHAPEFSHHRFASHYRIWSHNRQGSHERRRSHHRYASHERRESHNRQHSHLRAFSHHRVGSHDQRRSHSRFGSHDKARSHWRIGSHNERASHAAQQSHSRSLSHIRSRSHTTQLSHNRRGSTHSQAISRGPAKVLSPPRLVHTRAMSSTKAVNPGGRVTKKPVHKRAISQANAPKRIVTPRPLVRQGPAQVRRLPPGRANGPAIRRGGPGSGQRF